MNTAPSAKLSINWNDLVTSLKTGLFSAVIPIILAFVAPLYNALTVGQIPFLTVQVPLDWHVLVTSLVAAITATIGSVVKRFFMDEFGNIFGTLPSAGTKP